MRLFATCARGLEDASAAEVAEVAGACGALDHGKVFFAATWPQVCDLQLRARTLHRLALLLARGPVKDLADVEAAARSVDWGALLDPSKPFAVRPTRAGRHGFTSLDVGRAVGQAVIDRVQADRGARIPVDLRRPDAEVLAVVRDEEVLLGLDLTGDSLHRRGYRVYQHPAPLRPTLAAALLAWAGYAGQPLWDPLCGSGTIPIEAALLARGAPANPARRFLMERLPGFPAEVLAEARARAVPERPAAAPLVLGSDRSPEHLEGARANARAAGAEGIAWKLLDVALAEPADLPFAPRLVVANPPYGLRIASKKTVVRLYGEVLDRIGRFGAERLVVLVGNRRFEEAAARRGLAPAEAREVRCGDLAARALRFDLVRPPARAPAPRP